MEVAKWRGQVPGEIQPKHYDIAPEHPEQVWVPIRIKDGEVALIRLGPSMRLRPNSPARVRAVLLLDAVEGLSVNHGFEMVPRLARPGATERVNSVHLLHGFAGFRQVTMASER